MDMNELDEHEREVTDHVHAQIGQYSRAHYTIDYKEFTIDWISEMLEELLPVPLTDPTALVLPTDPLKTFFKIRHIETLEPYVQILESTDEAMSMVAEHMNKTKPSGALRSAREAASTAYSIIPDPILPIEFTLTARRRKTIAAIGKGLYKKSIPDAFSSLSTVHPLVSAKMHKVPEPKLPFDDLLNINWNPNVDDIRPHLQPLLTIEKTSKIFDDQSYIDRFDLSACRTVTASKYEDMVCFVPMFPRTRGPGQASVSNGQTAVDGPRRWGNVPVHVPPEIRIPSGSDDDIPLQSMRVVDGWQTVCSSSPLTSPQDGHDESEEDMVDQLCLPSSPDTEPPLAEEVHNAKLDIPLFSRSRRVGGRSGVQPHILKDQSVSTFLPALIPELKQTDDKRPTTDLAAVNSSPILATSMLGQGSELVVVGDGTKADIDVNVDVDTDIEHLYRSADPALILDEKIDEDKSEVIMEVPDLPEPTTHPRHTWIPERFVELTTPDNVEAGGAEEMVRRPVARKATGSRAITIALSWVTFTTTEKLPSLAHILHIDRPLPAGLPDRILNDAQDLLKASCIPVHVNPSGNSEDDDAQEVTQHAPEPYLAILDGDGGGCAGMEDPFKQQSLILLGRVERQRVSGRSREIQDDDDNDPTAAGNKSDEFYEGGGRKRDFDDLERDGAGDDLVVSGDTINANGRKDDTGLRPVKRPRCLSRSKDSGDDDSRVYAKSTDVSVHPSAQLVHGHTDCTVEQAQDAPYLDEEAQCSHYYPSGRTTTVHEHINMPYDEEEKENWDPSSDIIYDMLCDDPPGGGGVGEVAYEVQDDEMLYEDFLDRGDDASRQLVDDPVAHSTHPVPVLDESLDRRMDSSPPTLTMQRDLAVQSGKLASRMCESLGDHSLSFDSLQANHSLFSHSSGILDFARLRSAKISDCHDQHQNIETSHDSTEPSLDQASISHVDEATNSTLPPELIDKNTITLEQATSYPPPATTHHYLSSLETLQKRALVKSLRSPDCLVDLMERTTLSGVHLILDCSTAILFIPLLTLPADCALWIELLNAQSWKYTWIYIMFEAYPESCAYKSEERKSELYAYTSPIVKAVRKFRRDVALSAACGSQSAACEVRWAFADCVGDAARFVRYFGDLAESRDGTGGAIWGGERAWLEHEHEDECDLAKIAALNHFSSALVLFQVGVDEFLGMSAQERYEQFGSYIGMDTIAAVNDEIESRFQRSSEADQMIDFDDGINEEEMATYY